MEEIRNPEDYTRGLEKRAVSPLLTERPDFGPRQIRSLDEIRPGQEIIMHQVPTEYKRWEYPDPEEKARVIRVKTIKNGDVRIYIETEGGRKEHIFGSDSNVVPYKNSAGSELWSNTNWLEDPAKTIPPSDESAK